MEKTWFACPICGGRLEKKERTGVCEKGHSFDIARQGYIHLLPVNKMHSAVPGDTKEMVDARRNFLEAGYYGLFRQALCRILQENLKEESPVILDAGCGEGYYTCSVAEAFPNGQVLGFDISKAAVKAAAGKYKSVSFGVASCFAIPMEDNSCHCLFNVFAPIVPEEFRRVVKPGGFLLLAVPGERHLYGMKEILYDAPYENPHRDTEYPGFTFLSRQRVEDVITVPDGKTAMELFSMTPYYWKTSKEGGERLMQAGAFQTEIVFDFLLYQRTEEFS